MAKQFEYRVLWTYWPARRKVRPRTVEQTFTLLRDARRQVGFLRSCDAGTRFTNVILQRRPTSAPWEVIK